MSNDAGDKSDLPADEVTRKYAKKLFAEIAVRIVAYGADMVLVLLGVTFVVTRIYQHFGVADAYLTATWVFLLFLYFAASWLSPLRATPVQFVLGMRVLDTAGKRLSYRSAAIRSAVLVAQWWLILEIFDQVLVPELLLKAIAVGVLIFIPAITRRRQGVHDFLAGSIVVNRRSLRSSDDEQRMLDFLASDDSAVHRASRPPLYKMLLDAVVLAIPIYLLASAVDHANQRNMYARVVYALSEASEMKQAVEYCFGETGKWPTSETDLGLPHRHPYPDGGYYVLENDGRIRIQFEIRPELKNGYLLLVPSVDDGKFVWECRSAGNIEHRYLPNNCRN